MVGGRRGRHIRSGRGDGEWAAAKLELVRRGGGVGNGEDIVPLLAAGRISKCGRRCAALHTVRPALGIPFLERRDWELEDVTS
jgi:hypothetical protein